jgi:hypothetical protein
MTPLRPHAFVNDLLYETHYWIPVLDLATVRMILALSVIWHFSARHGDIPAAYTKAAIESDSGIFMYPPNGMTLTQAECAAGGPTAVLKLQRSLYGLKQAVRLWNNMPHAQLIAIGYIRCKTDLCLYYKNEGECIAVVAIYVGKLLATATSTRLVDNLFENLKSLEVKDLSTVRNFLGMRVQFEEMTVTPLIKKRSSANFLKPIK